MRSLLLLTVVAIAASAAYAGESPQIPATGQKIRIDGNIEAAEWAGIAVQPLPYETDPQRVAATTWQTTVRVTHDGRNLLVAVDARDEHPDLIVASRGARDSIGNNEDYVTVMIDAEGNRQRHYEFTVNAAGTLNDSIIGGAASGSPQWSGTWEAAAQRTSTGYTVEMTIPLTTLNASSNGKSGMSLPMNVSRRIGRDRRETLAQLPIDTRLICQECQYEAVTLTGIGADKQTITVRPYVAARRSTLYPVGGGSDSDTSADPGVDVLWQLGRGRKLVGTINPDFSEVAPDQIQFDVNRRFAVTFFENRTFFTENAGAFGTSLPLVNTRSIADPSAAIAYSSTSSRATMAALYARDRATTFTVPGRNGSRSILLDGGSETFLGRLQHNGAAGNRFGTLMTARRGEGYNYQMAALDNRTTFGQRQTVEAIVAFSHAGLDSANAASTLLPEEASGGVVRVQHNFKNENLNIQSTLYRATPDFRPDTGNFNRVGITQLQHMWFLSLPQAPGGLVSNITGNVSLQYADQLHSVDRDGNFDTFVIVTFADGSSADANGSATIETWRGEDYNLYDFGGGYAWQINPSVRVNAGFKSAKVIDFFAAETGMSFQSNAGFTVKMGSTFNMNGSLNLDSTHGESVRNFSTRSGLLRANWSPRLGHTVSLVANWGATRTRMKLTSDPVTRSDRLRGQVVYLYQRPDRSAFHIGVNLGGSGTDGMQSVRRTDELIFSKVVMNLDWNR